MAISMVMERERVVHFCHGWCKGVIFYCESSGLCVTCLLRLERCNIARRKLVTDSMCTFLICFLIWRSLEIKDPLTLAKIQREKSVQETNRIDKHLDFTTCPVHQGSSADSWPQSRLIAKVQPSNITVGRQTFRNFEQHHPWCLNRSFFNMFGLE